MGSLKRLIIGLGLSSFVLLAQAQQALPDAPQLAEFYQSTGSLYAELKKATTDVLEKRLSAQRYVEQMEQWRETASQLDTKAPCMNQDWQEHYTVLTPAHHDVCFAWGSLKDMQHYLLSPGDSEAAIYHELRFREAMQEALAKFENPENNEATDLWED